MISKRAIIFTVAFIASTRAGSSENISTINSCDGASYAQPTLTYSRAKQVLPYAANLRDTTVTTSLTYPKTEGEILIHKPATIVVKRPPTQIVVNHPSLYVKPAPVIFHKPPAIVVRKVAYKTHPKQVKVEPVYVSVVKSAATKYYLNEHQQKQLLAPSTPASYAYHRESYDPSNASNSFAGDTGAPDLSRTLSSSELSDYGGQPVYSDAHNNAATQSDNKIVHDKDLPTLASLVHSAPSYFDPSTMA